MLQKRISMLKINHESIHAEKMIVGWMIKTKLHIMDHRYSKDYFVKWKNSEEHAIEKSWTKKKEQ